MQKYLTFFLILFGFHFSTALRVGFSSEKWVVTQTPHFDVHHSAQQQDLGLYYAHVAEIAYSQLSTVFSNKPDKVTLIINDSTDSSNGYATVLPYPLIMIYPVQINNQETLSEAGEWARELLTHELTHIFQMYPTNGFYKWLRPIFGSIISPNMITPSWWKEGMAIEMETRFSPQGRSRSNLHSATIRSLVNDGVLTSFTLAEANETLKTWPYGNRPYFFGSMMMSEIAADGGPSAINHIVERQSERFPYFLDAPIKEAIDRSYQNEFYKVIDTQTKQAQKQINTLKTVPLTPITAVDDTLLSSRHPRYNENLKILALIGQKKSGTEILFYKWNDSEKKYSIDPEQKKLSGTLGTFEFHPTEPKIIFSKIDAVSSKENFSDLYIYDLNTKEETQITHSSRAREPYFSIDGNDAIFISTADGQTSLKKFNFKTEKIATLLKSNLSERITQAIYLSQDLLLINVRNKVGEQMVYQLNLEDKTKLHLPEAPRQVSFMKKTNDQIYFTDTANGVSNIYSSPATKNIFKTVTPESHLLTGALSFDISNQKRFASLVGSQGTKVYELGVQSTPVTLPKIENEIARRYKFVEPAEVHLTTTQGDYSIWPLILPHYWIPFIGTSSSNKGYFVQAQTSGNDPLNLHTYQASLTYESDLNKIGFNFAYLNSVFDWEIEALALQTQKVFGTSSQTIFQKNSYALGILPDVFQISKSFTLGFGFQYNKIDDSFLTTEHSGYFIHAIYKTFEQKVFQYFPMSGWGASLKYENMKAQKDLGLSLGDYSQASTTMTAYFSKWLPEDHSMMFKVDGLYNFNQISSRFGTSNTQFPIASDGLISQFALRGYQSGQFFGSQLFTATAEYRFPIKQIHRGSGTNPFFVKTLTGAIVFDGLAAKGFGVNEFDSYIPIKLSEQYWNTGVEARLSTTIGYFIPMNFILGYYLPFSPHFAKSGQTALSLQLGGF